MCCVCSQCFVLLVDLRLKQENVDEHISEYTAKFANPMIAAQRGFVDDIIDPQDTRRILCNDLRLLRTKETPEIKKKHSNIPL